MTIVIGLTGGIGSGKSTISKYLEELGAVLIDADQVGHEILLKGTPAWHEIIAVFGQGVMAETGEIDRKKLGQIVFDKPEARERLNRIMWARIWDIIKDRIERYRREMVEVVVVEAFGLVEAGWDKLVDQVWVTNASEKTVIERLKKQRGLQEEEIIARIRSQLSIEERALHADTIIENDGSPEAVKEKVKEFWDKLITNNKHQAR